MQDNYSLEEVECGKKIQVQGGNDGAEVENRTDSTQNDW